MQEITQHLSDIETELTELGKKLEDVRQQIHDVSMMARPKQEIIRPTMSPLQSPSTLPSRTVSAEAHSSVADSVRHASSEQSKQKGNGFRRNLYSYGSTYRPDKWMNVPTAPVVANGIQETWSVGNELSSGISDVASSAIVSSGITNSGVYARQSEYSIHARP